MFQPSAFPKPRGLMGGRSSQGGDAGGGGVGQPGRPQPAQAPPGRQAPARGASGRTTADEFDSLDLLLSGGPPPAAGLPRSGGAGARPPTAPGPAPPFATAVASRPHTQASLFSGAYHLARGQICLRTMHRLRAQARLCQVQKFKALVLLLQTTTPCCSLTATNPRCPRLQSPLRPAVQSYL